MNFKLQLKAEISKRNTDYIVSIIDGSPKRFEMLWKTMITSDTPVPHRASWAITTCFDRWPELLQPYLEEMIDFIPESNHTGIKRCLLRILALSEIPDSRMGNLLNLCFEYLETDMPVAVKVHAMQIIYNISQAEPDIKTELIAIIEEQMPKQSVGFENRGRKLLKKLYSETGIH